MEKRRFDYQKALEFRSTGMTYGEIRKAFGIPKSTLSNWFKDFKVKGKALTILKKKQGENMTLLAKFNKERSLRIKKKNEDIRKEFESSVGSISLRELILVGAALYWAEITNIPINQFRYYTAISRASRQKRPKNMLPYGTLYVRIKSRQEFFKIKGLIDGIIKSIK